MTVGESQNGPLGFWTKAMPSKEENLYLLKKEFPVCLLPLAETKSLARGIQVDLQPKLPVRNWV